MNGLQVLRFTKTAASTVKWGGSSNGLAYRALLPKPAEPKLPHPSRQKLEAKMMKPQVLRENCSALKDSITPRITSLARNSGQLRIGR